MSTAGGDEAAWSRDGREIFYRDGKHLMAVDVRTAPSSTAGTPRALFDHVFVFSANATTGYSVGPDGRFLFAQRLEPDPPVTHLNVALNWFGSLRQALAAAK